MGLLDPSLVCPFVCAVACSFVFYSCVCLFACLLACLFVCVLVRLFAFAHLFLFGRAFRPFVRLFVI